MRNSLFSYVRAKMLQKKKSPFHPFLHACSYFYRVAVWVRKALYKKGIFPSFRASSFVISIGSPIAGGTGKTPLVLYLLRQLDHTKCAVLLRGYRGTVEHTRISREVDALNPTLFGDEAVLIKKSAPNLLVLAGKRRKKSLQSADTQKKKLCILDDGFQHWSVQRDLDLVILQESDLQEQQWHLPRGFLRESLRALARADLVFIEGTSSLAVLRTALLRYTKAPFVLVRRILATPRLRTGVRCTGTICGVFCAIARPEPFLSGLQDLGWQVCYAKCFPDHSSFSREELEKIWRKSQALGATVLLCTEKDFVKVPATWDIPIAYVPLAFQMEGEELIWKLIPKEVCSPARASEPHSPSMQTFL
ncbi:MAG: tetraacyldisaccharide 4'-kinase [Chlamydiota bacterium]